MYKWFILALMATIIATSYWTYFAINQYNTFHTYFDLGLYSYDFFQHIHYASALWGLQYLSFGNHLSPTTLLLLPYYAIYQSPIILLVLQAFIVIGSGMLVYWIADDLLKNSKIAFLLCVAYLMNVGLWGIIVFDFHVELWLIPFTLLTFYFYMKEKRIYFFISLGLLLGSMEWGPVIAFTLGLALLVYDRRINKKWSKLALVMMIISLVAFGLYYIGIIYLLQAYSLGLYPKLPVILRVYNTIYTNGTLANQGVSGITLANIIATLTSGYGLYGIMIMLISLGITAWIFVPDVAAILILPWFIEAYILGAQAFTRVWDYYYSFLIGNLMVATILSFMVMLKQKDNPLQSFCIKLMVMMLFIFAISYPLMVYSRNVNELSAQFLFEKPQAYGQILLLKSIMRTIPSNASIVTNQYIAGHFTNRRYVNVFNYTNNTWFTPEYVLGDFNLNLSLNAQNGGQYAEFNSLVHSGNYTLVIKDGSIQVWRLK